MGGGEGSSQGRCWSNRIPTGPEILRDGVTLFRKSIEIYFLDLSEPFETPIEGFSWDTSMKRESYQ